jgi:hypothetical protein
MSPVSAQSRALTLPQPQAGLHLQERIVLSDDSSHLATSLTAAIDLRVSFLGQAKKSPFHSESSN